VQIVSQIIFSGEPNSCTRQAFMEDSLGFVVADIVFTSSLWKQALLSDHQFLIDLSLKHQIARQ
jgi:hypothetical protein